MKKPSCHLFGVPSTLLFLCAISINTQAGTLRQDTTESDPGHRWQLNGKPILAGTDIDVGGAIDVSLQLDANSSADRYWLNFYQKPDDTTAAISASIVTSSAGTAALQSDLASTSVRSLVSILGKGAQDMKHNSGALGPKLSVAVSAPLKATFDQVAFAGRLQGPTSAYQFRSEGADAWVETNALRQAANGSAVSVDLQVASGGGLVVSGNLGPGNSSLPWRAGAALLTAVSKGGEGYVGQKSDLSSPGAFGANVKVTVGKGTTLQLGSLNDPLRARADSPVVGVLALSQGGMGGHSDGHMADNGKGGEVDLRFNGALTGNAPYTMGIVAASVGAASEDPTNAQKSLSVSGGGSNVDVHLQGGTIDLASTNVIGLVATSTADNPVGKGDGKPVINGGPNSYRDVSVSLDAGSRITVGNTTDKPSATDTTIGVLANSSVAWNHHPFGGSTPGTQTSPGKAGNITVSNQGAISATGSQAIGILAQSIAGDGASISGGVRPFVGGSGDLGGEAGYIVYVGDGGKITATGDGAVGLQMQSIAGGGGNGGNAAGLFVAVGGKGGAGGTAGTLSLSQKNGGTITTSGDYAQGVLMQSIGGGGGNGGYAKAFSLGLPVTGTVGGSGGSGGTGGDVLLGGLNDAGTDQTGAITTSGQHAHGIVAQTIGSGGGKGGAAHNYDAGTGLTVSLAVGGSGGRGGKGGDILGAAGAARGSSIGNVITTGHDAFGMALQSIGGGGGMGGASTAAAFSALSFPEMPNVTISIGLGGSGGIGGDGGNIGFDLVNDMQTRGASSTGLVMQSIGGGGGIGGDATAGSASFLANSEFSLSTSVAVGGTGGAGGKGGKVDLGLSGTQTTRGHNANAIVVQSIGGGGGLGGVGNAATVVAVPLEESNYSVALGVGGAGGKGANGGDVTVASRSASVIRTLGSGASGITAQSIGGGGGIAGDAGTQGIGGKLKTQIAAGGNGGSGNHGGKVSVNYSGQISTGGRYQVRYDNASGGTSMTTPIAVGGGSHGIVAQSIGGGGGKAGNADPSKALLPDLAETIIDDANKLMDAKGTVLWLASRVVDWQKKEHEFPKAFSVGVAVGGTGGAGGNGGEVDVSIGKDTTILTQGHRSYGIFAQSIGGGGGEAGSAAGDALLDSDIDLSPLTGADFDLTVNVGGKGGAAGSGGNVRVDTTGFGGTASNNVIATSGYGSHAVFMQSVGGGGGVAHEGSIFGLGGKLAGADVPAVSLGNIDASKASSGDGGSIYFGKANFSVSRLSQIKTAGDDAAALFAQSVGGGGGLASVGCTNSGRASASLGASACHTNAGTATSNTPSIDGVPRRFLNGQQVFHVELKGDGEGKGGAISLDPGAGTYATTGDRSPVIVAQSIGSGGGYLTADMANLAHTNIESSGKPGGSGGEIDIGVAGMHLTATGHGSWGILAQSIGSGGGVVGDPSADLLSVPEVNISSTRKSGSHGGDVSVSVTSGSTILVGQGSDGEDIVNAHAIVAQSLGSSGGILSTQTSANGTKTDSTLQFYAANWLEGYGGHISIDTGNDTTIETRAIGGVAILAQSGGRYANDYKDGIDVSIEGQVIGGRTGKNPRSNRNLNGVGVMVSGGGVKNSGFENQITVTKSGSITTQGGAKSGFAIQTNYGVTNVDNSGVITGSIDLGDTPGKVTNNASGVLNAGSIYRVDGSSVDNYGTLNVGLTDTVGATTIDGRLDQFDGGRMVFTVNAANADASHDTLNVNGTANLGGTIEVHALSLLPTSHAIVEASTLNFTGVVKQSLLFDWAHSLNGDRLSIAPIAKFHPAGMALDRTAHSLASYLERGWLRADRNLATTFGYLSHINTAGLYQHTLDQLGGQHLQAQPQQMLLSAYNSFSDSMNCPMFQTPAIRKNESGCTWARVSGNLTDQSATGHNLGYESEGGGLRVGVQRELGNQKTFGASVGANLNRLTADGFTSKGQVFDASVSLRRQVGDWSFTGALAGAHGSFRNERSLQLGTVGDALRLNNTYTSRSKMTMLGARLRTAYEITFENSYLRPYLDLDVMYNRTPGFSESGAGPLGLNVASTSKVNLAITPMIEMGTAFDINANTSVRTYASAGVSFLPNNRRTSQHSFVGALSSVTSFNATTEGPSAIGRLNLGVQVFNKDGLELSAEYGLQTGNSYRSQNVSGRLAYRF